MRRATVRPLLTALVLAPSLVFPLSGCRSGGGLTGWSAPSWMSWNNWGWGNRTASSLAQNKPSTTVPKPSTTTSPQPLSSVAAGTGNSTQGGYAPNPHYTTVTGTYPPGTSPAVAAAGLNPMASPQPGTVPAAGYQTGPYSTSAQPPGNSYATAGYPTAGYPTAGYPAAGNSGYPTAANTGYPTASSAGYPAAAAAAPQSPTYGYPTAPQNAAANQNAYAAAAGPASYSPAVSPANPSTASYPTTYPPTTPTTSGYAASTAYPTTSTPASAATSAYGQPAYPTTAPASTAGGYAAAAGSRYGGSVYGPESGAAAGNSATGTAPAAYHTPSYPTTPSAATGVWSGYSQPANAPYDQRSSTTPARSSEGGAQADATAVAAQPSSTATGRGSSIYGGQAPTDTEPGTGGTDATSPAAASGGGVAVASYPPVPSSLAPEAGGYRPGSTAATYGVQNAGYQQPAATAAGGGSVYGGSVTR